MKKNANRFLRSLIIYCLVLIVIIGAGLFVLNRFLVSYEASRPDRAMEKFMSEKDRSFWLSGLENVVDTEFNEFTKADALLSDFGLDENAEISWRSNISEGDEMEYDVRLGSSRICRVSFVPGDDVGFGMNSWEVSGWKFSIPGGTDIRVSVPTGSTVTINGVEADSSYISGIGSMEIPLEHSFDIAPASDIYEISRMMGPAEIKAFDSLGNELNAQVISKTEVAFLPEPVSSFSFCALPGSSVYINGVEITGEYCSPLDLGLGDHSSGIMLYECTGLFSEGEISVIHEGESVSPFDAPFGKCFIPGASKTIDGKLAEFVEGFIYAYINFSADKDNTTEDNFAALAKYLLRSSELYTLTSKTIENITWVTTDNLVYNSIDYYDLLPLGDGKYICSISYDISYTIGASRDLNIQSGNLILIEEVDGKYYVSDMSTSTQ